MLHYLLIILLINAFIQYNISTIIGMKCTDGIILASDSLLTQSPSSPLVVNRLTKNIFHIKNNIIICNVKTNSNNKDNSSGFFKFYNTLYHVIYNYEDTYDINLSVDSIAYIARKLIYYEYPNIHIIIAGHDNSNLIIKSYDNNNECNEDSTNDDYCLYEILPGGTIIDQDCVIAGSGSTIIETLVKDRLSSYEDHSKSSIAADNIPATKGFAPASLRGNNPLVSNHKVTYKSVVLQERPSISNAVPIVTEALAQAARLDPYTGGERYSILQLSIKNK